MQEPAGLLTGQGDPDEHTQPFVHDAAQVHSACRGREGPSRLRGRDRRKRSESRIQRGALRGRLRAQTPQRSHRLLDHGGLASSTGPCRDLLGSGLRAQSHRFPWSTRGKGGHHPRGRGRQGRHRAVRRTPRGSHGSCGVLPHKAPGLLQLRRDGPGGLSQREPGASSATQGQPGLHHSVRRRAGLGPGLGHLPQHRLFPPRFAWDHGRCGFGGHSRLSHQ